MSLDKQRLIQDCKYWVDNGLVQIRHKDSKLGIATWGFNPEQELYYNQWTNRDIIIKPRQCGWSTIAQWRGGHKTITNRGYQYLGVYHKLQAAQKALTNMKIMINSLPKTLCPTIDRNNVSMISFPVLQSGMSVVNCGRTPEAADEIGKSETINFLHLSEVAFYMYPKQTLTSTMNCVPKPEDDGIIVIESTANGFNEFQRRVMEAYNGLGVFKVFFSPWFKYSEHSIRNATWVDLGALTQTEVEIIDKYNLTPQQLMWRRFKIAELGSERIFSRDFPSDIFSCFTRLEGCIFAAQALDAYVNMLLQPLYGYKKEFMIFQPPIKGKEYVIAADVAGGKRKGHYCSGQIIARDNWEQVGHIFGKWPPDVYGDHLAQFGELYNGAEIGVENDGIGQGTIARLKSLGYKNLYRHKSSGAFGALQFEYGFPTTPKTRKILIDDLEEAVRKLEVTIHCAKTLDCMRTFVLREDMTIGGAVGCDDDPVMALGIAVQMLKQPKFTPQYWNR